MRQSIALRLLSVMALILAPTAAQAASWEIAMQSQTEKVTWSIDEQLGVRTTISSQPQLEVIVRFDEKQTYFVNRAANVHATRPFASANGRAAGGEFGGLSGFLTPEQQAALKQAQESINQRLQDAPPEAQNYAQQFLQGKIGSLQPPQTRQVDQVSFQATGQGRRLNGYNTTKVLELRNGRPTGRQFWVADVPNWRRIAKAMEQAVEQMEQGMRQEEIAYSELGGIPVRIVDADGQTSDMVSFQETRAVNSRQMSPGTGSQNLNLMQFMMQYAAPTRNALVPRPVPYRN